MTHLLDWNNRGFDEFATELDLERLTALREHGNATAAARSIGISRSALRASMANLERRAAKRGFVPKAGINHQTADHLMLKGHSDFIDEDGNIKRRWLKYDTDKQELLRQMELAIEALSTSAPVRPVEPEPVDELSADLLNQYTFTDYHLGMLAWHREGGDNWNVEIATDTLKRAFLDMINRAPKAKACVINQLGDFLHFDSMTPETPTSGHPLDADTRPEKMVEAAIECMDYLIETALKFHSEVIVVIAQGNHDLYSSIWLRKMFGHMYKDNARVTFVDNAAPFYAIEWGCQMLGYHHGHKVKFGGLPSLFMDQFREMYGRTTKTAIHMGHHHHQEIKEVGTTVVEMHRTLAARDSHASYGGYHSERASDVITYHKKHGEIERKTVRPFLFGDC